MAATLLALPLDKMLANQLANDLVIEEETSPVSFTKNFSAINDRTWIGEQFWAVPMEDWSIQNGRLQHAGKEKKNRVHLLTHTLKQGDGMVTMQSAMGINNDFPAKGSTGFCVGIVDTTDESYKSGCYYGDGVQVGITTEGELFIGDKKQAALAGFSLAAFTLSVTCITTGDESTITLSAIDNNNKQASLVHSVSNGLSGLVAIEAKVSASGSDAFWYNNVTHTGNKVNHTPSNSYGPILWTMYTMTKGKVKLTVQMLPLGVKDAQTVQLHLGPNKRWKKVDEQPVDASSFTAHFVLHNWNSSLDVPYKIIYQNKGVQSSYEGTFRKEPLSGTLKFAGLTCQQWGGYPYRPVMENLEKHNPDILYFSGDQIYEENGGYPIKRQPKDKAILSYLGKWYMFGWVFGNVMRDRPTICTPDDHDVFQGNLWGEGGQGISFTEWEKVKDAHGGLVQTPAMVNVVNKTQCGHLPDPYLKDPLPSGITNWFTHLVYGRVSFAIVSDRMFKSGPEMVRNGTGRIDHIKEPLSPGQLEKDGLTFMGNPQMRFLNEWVEDWQGADMKVLLSQTLFSNVGTHHGENKMFLYGDMDSGGWPKQQRDEVLRTIRKACAFHINGDQHVPFIVQYSIDEPRDAGWTFCTPAISTGYPRWGQPDLANMPIPCGLPMVCPILVCIKMCLETIIMFLP